MDREHNVRLARAEGSTWAQLGRLLHRIRQAVRQRHGHVDGTVQPLPPSRTAEQIVVAMVGMTRDDDRRRREFEGARHDELVAW